MRRRTFLRTGSLGLLTGPSLARAANSVKVEEAFDAEMNTFMQPRGVPGGAIAVVRNGRLVFAKGYGWADREQKTEVRPESLFRIASISKPFTAVAILQLVESGRLPLEARAFAVLGADLSKAPDPRLAQITVNHLLHHTAGWDRGQSFDPMFRSRQIALSVAQPPPAPPSAIVEYMLGQRLQTDPGTAYAYSNFGYCVLGRIIEKLTGQPYEAHVKAKLLAPAGIRATRLGATLRASRVPGEVCYYTPKEEIVASVFNGPPERVTRPYGGFCLEAMDAHGGWVASVVDLARFAAALDDPSHSPLLRRETFDLLYAPPAPPVSRKGDGALADSWYACGWSVRPVGREGRANYWHAGSLPGTATLLVRRHDGLSWAVCFNQRSEDEKLPDSAIDAALHRAADRVGTWPEGTRL